MKFLYYASYVLSAPFFAVSWVFLMSSYLICWIGNTIHEGTTYRAWLVLHRRECSNRQRIEKENAHAS